MSSEIDRILSDHKITTFAELREVFSAKPDLYRAVLDSGLFDALQECADVEGVTEAEALRIWADVMLSISGDEAGHE